MIKKTLEGISILPSPPTNTGPFTAPVIHLEDGLILDDKIMECGTLLLGNVGSGKTILLDKCMNPIIKHAEEHDENVVIFCAKKDFLKYKRPQDIVVSLDTTDPKSCLNIFRELKASKNPEITARDIAKALTQDQRSETQPFFENACNDLIFNVIMCLYEEGKEYGTEYTNWHLADFLRRTTVSGEALTWKDVAISRPERFGHTSDYFGQGDLGQGYGVASEIRTLLHECFWGSFCSDKGEFSIIESLKEGGKRIFLYYDYANSSQASIKFYRTILNLLFKHCTDEDNQRRTWVFLDEASLLPKTCITDALSLGRSAGLRLFMCLQSAELMKRHYTETEAKTILSLFPNILCLKVQDSFSRSLLADRYGKALCSYGISSAIQKTSLHVQYSPVVSDYDFSQIKNKGDAICSIPNLSNAPFYYHGYRKELE